MEVDLKLTKEILRCHRRKTLKNRRTFDQKLGVMREVPTLRFSTLMLEAGNGCKAAKLWVASIRVDQLPNYSSFLKIFFVYKKGLGSFFIRFWCIFRDVLE